jgi:hypothetical protein
VPRPGVVRIDRLGLELATEGSFRSDIEDDDPLSATTEMRQLQTVSRGSWQVKIETSMRLSCTRDVYVLQASMRAWHGEAEVSSRTWDRKVPRDCT